MTQSEIDTIRRAVSLLNEVLLDNKLATSDVPLRRCPVTLFAERYLARQSGEDMTSAELWTFFLEVVQAGELEALSKEEFMRALPKAMSGAFGLKKSHNLRRGGQTLRGFKSVTIKEETGAGN